MPSNPFDEFFAMLSGQPSEEQVKQAQADAVKELYDLHVAFIEAGFTIDQAFQLVLNFLARPPAAPSGHRH